MHRMKGLLALVFVVISGCGGSQEPAPGGVDAPFVRTALVAAADAGAVGLSGTVRARYETPVAFQVGGRIAARRVDAGQVVQAGQILFELDARDLEQASQAAQADVAAAEAALAMARADLGRVRQLKAQNFVSAQALERSELAEREVRTRLDAARARLAQARNALGYARLSAPTAGVLVEVSGEPGQVVATGKTVATLAREGEREVEVFFPDAVRPPASGQLIRADGAPLPLRLREVSGAVDPQSRTWRARYSVAGGDALALGSVVRAAFATPGGNDPALSVPIAALDERGEGPRVWQVVDGRAQPVAVELVALDAERARVRGGLKAGDTIIALGTHLLTPGMAVRELAQ
jgi:RND family efflux transporter MFP subunit